MAEAESTTATAVAESFALSDEGRALLQPTMGPETFLHALERAGMYGDALSFLAHWLPPREAIWWGCQCVWELHRSQTSNPVETTLRTIVHWVLNPSEPLRRQAETWSEELGVNTPVGCLALAVFSSGGTLSLPNLPAVEPPGYMSAQCSAGAVLLTAAEAPSEHAGYYQRLFVSLGLDIAHGKNLWN